MKSFILLRLHFCFGCLLAPFAGAQEATAEHRDTEPLAVHRGHVRLLIDSDSKESPIPSDRAKERRVPLRIRLETWEAPALEVAKRLDELQGDESIAALRAKCLEGMDGVNLIHSPVTTADASTEVGVESLSERIYATEYEPPDLVCGPTSSLGEEKSPKSLPEWMEQLMTSATPTSYETRETGSKLTALAQAVAVEEKSWDVAVSFEDVGFTGTENFGHESLRITMPVMASFATGGLVRLKEGKWRLLSVMEPPRGLDGKPSDKRWVTLVRIDPEG